MKKLRPITSVSIANYARVTMGIAAFGLVFSLLGACSALPDKPVDDIADYPIKDFYLTNAICRASPTMERCSAELIHGIEWLEAAE